MLNVIIKKQESKTSYLLSFPKILKKIFKFFKKHKSKAAGLPAPKGRVWEEYLCVCKLGPSKPLSSMNSECEY